MSDMADLLAEYLSELKGIKKRLERLESAQKSLFVPKKFIKPSVTEVAAYIKEYCRKKNIKTTANAEAIWNFYESKGWKVGKEPMTSWHGAVGGWCQREAATKTDADINNEAARKRRAATSELLKEDRQVKEDRALSNLAKIVNNDHRWKSP